MEGLNVGTLIILGIGVFGGTVGATIFQRFRIPQVVAYIVIGLLIGDIGFGIVSSGDIERLQVLNVFALGVIGFLVGGEIQLETFRSEGARLFAILIGEGVGAFILVGIPVTIIVYGVAGSWAAAVAAGSVFGAIASATDPASTLNVLWESRSRGIFTTTLIAIVALDDALAMALYGMGTSIARILTGGSASISDEVLRAGIELAGAVLLGFIVGFLMPYLMHWLKSHEKTFAAAIGAMLLVIGIAATFQLDVILASMALGMTLVNKAPRRSKELFETVRAFANPIYVIFFVLVGARFNLESMPGWVWGIVGVYVVTRTAGKMTGAFTGARLTDADPAVQKFLGLGLFAQGGIAIGLSIMAGQHLGSVQINDTMYLGDLIVYGVTASTLIVQLIGPPLIQLAAKLSGEAGRDVTEEDVIAAWKVSDAMSRGIEPITIETPLSRVFQIFADHEHLVYPVIDRAGSLRGVISLDDLKEVMVNQDTWDWVLANDVMADAHDKISPDAPLAEAIDYMQERGLEELPVVSNGTDEQAVGILDQRVVNIRVNEEVLRQRQG